MTMDVRDMSTFVTASFDAVIDKGTDLLITFKIIVEHAVGFTSLIWLSDTFQEHLILFWWVLAWTLKINFVVIECDC